MLSSISPDRGQPVMGQEEVLCALPPSLLPPLTLSLPYPPCSASPRAQHDHLHLTTRNPRCSAQPCKNTK